MDSLPFVGMALRPYFLFFPLFGLVEIMPAKSCIDGWIVFLEFLLWSALIFVLPFWFGFVDMVLQDS